MATTITTAATVQADSEKKTITNTHSSFNNISNEKESKGVEIKAKRESNTLGKKCHKNNNRSDNKGVPVRNGNNEK